MSAFVLSKFALSMFYFSHASPQEFSEIPFFCYFKARKKKRMERFGQI